MNEFFYDHEMQILKENIMNSEALSFNAFYGVYISVKDYIYWDVMISQYGLDIVSLPIAERRSNIPHFELQRNTCGVTFSPPTYPIFGFRASHIYVTFLQGGDL